MNPERMAQQSIDRSRQSRMEVSPLMKRAYEKAQTEVLSNPDYTIQESEFTGGDYPVYDQHTVTADIALGERLQKSFDARQTPQERNTKHIADTLEAIVLMQSEMSNWLGNATTLKTSRYDDYVNKVDMISEWQNPQSGSQVLALAVDVTFGAKSIEKKIAQIKEEIDRGRLGSIRYFKDSRGDFMGTRNNVPRTVIGVSQSVVEELAGLWVNGEKKALGAHPIQRLLVSQMSAQLRAMEGYAAARDNHVAAQAYQQARGVITRVKDNQASIQLGGLSEDPVYQEILSQTRSQFKL
jgi:hypothetical protein